MERVTFSVARYLGYKPPRDNPRATVLLGRGRAMTVQSETWPGLIKLLRQVYPAIEFQVPEEVDLIEYDKKFNRL